MVAIKDFEMPASCTDCRFCMGECAITNEDIDWDYMDEYRSDNCPLIEMEEQTDGNKREND